MERMNIYKGNKAITLIALVITVIILIILAGITLNLALGENGVLNRAKRLQKEQDIARITEKLELAKAELGIENDYKAEVPDYIKHIVDKGIIKSDDVLDPENVENGKCYIIVEDKYVYEIKQEGDNIKITYVEDPLIIRLDTVIGTNSVKVKVRAYNLVDPEYTYYIKKATDSEYKKVKTQKSNEYIYEGLEQGETYEIKAEVKSKPNKKTDLSKKVTLRLIPPGTQEGAIKFSQAVWNEAHKASVSISTDTSFKIQYQINATTATLKDNSKWINGTEVTDLNLKDVIFARLWDENNGGSPATYTISDGILPTAKITLSSNTEVTGETIVATVEQKDEQSGINIAECKWIYNKTNEKVGMDASKYTGTFTNENQEINLIANEEGTWYVHVLTKDFAGNAIETISEGIEIGIARDITATLKPGDYVKYSPTSNVFYMTNEQTGYSQTQSFATSDYDGLWQVLYNDSTNGIQLISADSVGDLYIKGATGYNNIVTTLNAFCKNYENSEFTVEGSGRTVGTNPTNMNEDTTDTVSLVFTNAKLKAGDTRCTVDYQAMKNANSQNADGIQNIGGYYWMASRRAFSTSEVGYFSIYTVANGGEIQYRRLNDLYINDKSNEYEYAYGVRPIVKVKNEIKVVKGSGTSLDPYQIRKL